MIYVYTYIRLSIYIDRIYVPVEDIIVRYLAEVRCRNRNSMAMFDAKSLIVDIVIGGIGVCIYIVFYLNY